MAKNLTRCGEPLLRVRENVVKLNHAMERREYLLQRSRELQRLAEWPPRISPSTMPSAAIRKSKS